MPTFELARSQSLLVVAETKLGHIAAFFLGIYLGIDTPEKRSGELWTIQPTLLFAFR